MKKAVTLIELMVVIIILGILTAIAIPNVKNIRNQATLSQVGEDKANVQKAVDRFALEKGQFPTSDGSVPSLATPKQVDWTKLDPPYLIKKPQNLNVVYYWIDYFGTVWASDVDSPTNIQTANAGGGQYTITWDSVSGAVGYNVGYAVFDPSAGRSTMDINADKSRYVWLQQGVTGASTTITSPGLDLTAAKVVVNAISSNGLQSVPVEQGFTGSLLLGNNKPTAVITMTPDNSIYTDTSITWDHSLSTDPDSHAIVSKEWQLDSEPVATVAPNGIISTAGTHTMKLRVKDEKGMWSDWTSKTFTVSIRPFTPTTLSAELTLSTSSYATNATKAVVDSSGNIHLFSFNTTNNNIYAQVMDKDLNVISPYSLFISGVRFLFTSSTYASTFDVTIDSEDNIYVIYKSTDYIASKYPIYLEKYNKSYQFVNKITAYSDATLSDTGSGIAYGNNAIYFTYMDNTTKKTMLSKVNLDLSSTGYTPAIIRNSMYSIGTDLVIQGSDIYALTTGMVGSSSEYIGVATDNGSNFVSVYNTALLQGTICESNSMAMDTMGNMWLFREYYQSGSYYTDLQKYSQSQFATSTTQTALTQTNLVTSSRYASYINQVITLKDGRLMVIYYNGNLKYRLFY